MIQGNLADQSGVVCRPYREVLQTRSAAYERVSVLNQLDFLSEALAWKGEQELAGQASRLRKELEM